MIVAPVICEEAVVLVGSGGSPIGALCDTWRTAPSWRESSLLRPDVATSGSLPGRVCNDGVPITTWPSRVTKRGMSVIRRSTPPVSSHGIQTL